MPELSPKTKQYQKQRLRSLMAQQPMISTLGMQRHLAKDGLPLDRAAGLKEACEAYNNMFQMLFDAGVFKRRIGIGKRASHHLSSNCGSSEAVDSQSDELQIANPLVRGAWMTHNDVGHRCVFDHMPFSERMDKILRRLNGIARIDLSDGCQQGSKTRCTCNVRRICLSGERNDPSLASSSARAAS